MTPNLFSGEATAYSEKSSFLVLKLKRGGGVFPSSPLCLANNSRSPTVFASKAPKSICGNRCDVSLILSA